jgi:hypothetical protein
LAKQHSQKGKNGQLFHRFPKGDLGIGNWQS